MIWSVRSASSAPNLVSSSWSVERWNECVDVDLSWPECRGYLPQGASSILLPRIWICGEITRRQRRKFSALHTRTHLLRVTSVTGLGNFLLFLAINFLWIIAQIFRDFWAAFININFAIKWLWEIFEIFGLLFIPTSGRLGQGTSMNSLTRISQPHQTFGTYLLACLLVCLLKTIPK